MGLLKDMALRGRDMAVSAAFEKHAGKYASPFGTIVDVTLDSSQKSIELNVLLKGETEPVILKVGRYEILEESGRRLIVAREISASREWIDAAVKQYIQGRPFELPARVAGALGFLA